MGNEYYANAGAGGGGVGSQGDPFTQAEAIAFINAGAFANSDRMNYQNSGGVFLTTGITITASGANTLLYAHKRFQGCTSVAGDGGKATIQRSGGAADLLFFNCHYWDVADLILDGQNGGTYNFRHLGSTCLTERVESKNAGTYGFSVGPYVDCYAHDNGHSGFYKAIMYHCLTYNNFYYGASTTANGYFSIFVEDGYSSVHSPGIFRHCVFMKPGRSAVVTLGQYSRIENCIFQDIFSPYFGIDFGTYYTPFIDYNNFYNVDDLTDQLDTYLNTYYELDPQFVDPTSPAFDFRRTGDNLDDKGFSEIGMQTPDYGVDIGVDQRRTCTVPAIADVRSGEAYVDHGVDKTGTMTAVTVQSPVELAVSDPNVEVEVVV